MAIFIPTPSLPIWLNCAWKHEMLHSFQTSPLFIPRFLVVTLDISVPPINVQSIFFALSMSLMCRWASRFSSWIVELSWKKSSFCQVCLTEIRAFSVLCAMLTEAKEAILYMCLPQSSVRHTVWMNNICVGNTAANVGLIELEWSRHIDICSAWRCSPWRYRYIDICSPWLEIGRHGHWKSEAGRC